MLVVRTSLEVGKYVLMTDIKYTVDMRTVSRKCFLHPECSHIRCSYNLHQLYSTGP